MDFIYTDPACQGFTVVTDYYLGNLLNNSKDSTRMIYPYQKQIPFQYEVSGNKHSYLTEIHKELGPLHSVLCNGVNFIPSSNFLLSNPIKANCLRFSVPFTDFTVSLILYCVTFVVTFLLLTPS